MQEMAQAQTAPAAFNPALTPNELRLTEPARSKMAALIKETDGDVSGIRVYVSGGGCGGMSYGMTFTEGKTDYDFVLDAGDFEVYVDSVAMGFLKGVEIDYVERPTGASFVFNNVFAATGGSGVCGGCGARGGGCA